MPYMCAFAPAVGALQGGQSSTPGPSGVNSASSLAARDRKFSRGTASGADGSRRGIVGGDGFASRQTECYSDPVPSPPLLLRKADPGPPALAKPCPKLRRKVEVPSAAKSPRQESFSDSRLSTHSPWMGGDETSKREGEKVRGFLFCLGSLPCFRRPAPSHSIARRTFSCT